MLLPSEDRDNFLNFNNQLSCREIENRENISASASPAPVPRSSMLPAKKGLSAVYNSSNIDVNANRNNSDNSNNLKGNAMNNDYKSNFMSPGAFDSFEGSVLSPRKKRKIDI